MLKSNHRNPISFLTSLGTERVTDEELVNRIKVVNRLSLAGGAAILVVSVALCNLVGWKGSIVIPLAIDFLLNASVPVFNYYKLYSLARGLMYFLQCAMIAFLSFQLGRLLQLEIVIILLIAMTYLIFRGKVARYVALAAAGVDLVVLEVVYYRTRGELKIPVTFEELFFIHLLVVLSVIAIILLISKTYVSSNDLKYKLTKANQYIRIFTAQTTHELRSPLNAIHQIIQLLQKEVRKDEHLEKIGHLVEMALVASSSMRGVVANVLNMGEIEAGKTDRYFRQAFLVKPLFARLVEWNKVLAKSENMQLKYSIDGMPAVIISDQMSLGQITTNLLSNAIKYGGKGGTVTLHIARNQDKWTLQVTNQGGEGIPKERLPFLFDPFYSTKTGYIEGTGLGLYIVKNKVEALNGTIQVESEPNRFTRFTVTMPLIEGKIDQVPMLRTDPEVELLDLQGVHVLVAEDNKLSTMLVTLHLLDMQCRVTAVENGYELLKAAEADPPDLIMLDHHMPVMTGLDALLLLKKKDHLKDIPVIVVTGDLFSESLDKLLNAGADAWIEKPMDIHVLHRVISQCLAQRKQP